MAINMKKVLFVCTGNTCRSPIAEALFNSMANDEWLAFSRGIFADGSPISENSKAVLLENGIDMEHTSKPLTQEDVDEANVIFGLTSRHGQAILDKFPSASGKVYLMPKDIPDPYGCDIDAYRKCFDEIKTAIQYIIQSLGVL